MKTVKQNNFTITLNSYFLFFSLRKQINKSPIKSLRLSNLSPTPGPHSLCGGALSAE